MLPILDIYRKYYGWRMAGFLLVTFYGAMVAAALIVEFLFQGLGLVPTERDAKVVQASVTWNYTTVLNIVFLGLAAALVWRYFRRGGGVAMLRMMDTPMEAEHAHGHAARLAKRRWRRCGFPALSEVPRASGANVARAQWLQWLHSAFARLRVGVSLARPEHAARQRFRRTRTNGRPRPTTVARTRHATCAFGHKSGSCAQIGRNPPQTTVI